MVRAVKKSFGLLGGSFDPAHKGHLVISNILLTVRLKISECLFEELKLSKFSSKDKINFTFFS